MRRHLRLLSVACIASGLLIFAGCWDRTEVEDLGFVVATAVDPASEAQTAEGAGRLRVTVFIANPTSAAQSPGANPASGGGASPPGVILTGTGNTMQEALVDIQIRSPRWLHLAHNRVVAVSSAIARTEGLRRVLDFIDRAGLPRRTAHLIIVDGAAAGDLIGGSHIQERNAGEALSEVLLINSQRQSLLAVEVNDFLVDASLTGIDPVATLFVASTEAEAGGSPATAGGGESLGASHPRYGGAALFMGDRMVGSMNPSEARGLLWATGRAMRSLVEIPCPGKPDESMAFEIQRASGSIGIAGPLPLRGHIRVRMEGRLADVECKGDFMTSSAEVLVVNRLVEEAVRREIEAALAKSKALGVDPFGFGAELERAAPKLWRETAPNWRERVWPEFPVELAIRVDLRRPGLVSSPYKANP